jgi:hypothetical protein
MMGAMLRGAKGEVKLLSASALGRMRRNRRLGQPHKSAILNVRLRDDSLAIRSAKDWGVEYALQKRLV